jgi:hypothetical protein
MATKELKSAVPTVSTDTGAVVEWSLEVTMSEGSFSRDYFYAWPVPDLGKTPEQFTQAEMLAAAPPMLDEVFAHHKAVTEGVVEAPTETVPDFAVKSLRAS